MRSGGLAAFLTSLTTAFHSQKAAVRLARKIASPPLAIFPLPPLVCCTGGVKSNCKACLIDWRPLVPWSQTPSSNRVSANGPGQKAGGGGPGRYWQWRMGQRHWRKAGSELPEQVDGAEAWLIVGT